MSAQIKGILFTEEAGDPRDNSGICLFLRWSPFHFPQMYSHAHAWFLMTQHLLVLQWAFACWCCPRTAAALGIQRQPLCCVGPGEQVLCPEAGLNSLDEPLTGVAVYTAYPPLGWVFLGPCGSLFSKVLLQHPLQRQVKGFLEGLELDSVLCWRTLHPPEPVINLKQSGKHCDLPVHLLND